MNIVTLCKLKKLARKYDRFTRGKDAESLEDAAEALRSQGYHTMWRTVPAGGENVFTAPDVFEKSAVIFGCEATGVAELAGSRSLHIPMPGDTESLNVAQAATIVLFEYVRRIMS